MTRVDASSQAAKKAGEEPKATLSPLTPKFDTTNKEATPKNNVTPKTSTNKSAPDTASKYSKPASADPPVAPLRQQQAPSATAANSDLGEDKYPSVGKMEGIVFGGPRRNENIDSRLAQLEIAVFKTSYGNDSLFERTQRLAHTLLGGDPVESAAGYATPGQLRVPPGLPGDYHSDWTENPAPIDGGNEALTHFDELALRPDNQNEASKEDLERYALGLVNNERSKFGLDPLSFDDLAMKMAREHAIDLAKRQVVSHFDEKGNSPDRRYTLLGGCDAIVENLVALKSSDLGSKKQNRAAIVRAVKAMVSRQDDRDALMSPDATEMAIGLEWTTGRERLITCTEVLTKHGIIHPLPSDLTVGEKIEVKGVVKQPYIFEKITLAWEGEHNFAAASDESEEALPYFPPLDFIAYAQKSQKDHHGAATALKTMGIVAAIAGGMFFPPVALAAPLIAMSGDLGGSDPQPVSDIPVKGGVKIEGSVFTGKVPVTNENKEGLYYITVWAVTDGGAGKSVPISRRVVHATFAQGAETSSNDASSQ